MEVIIASFLVWGGGGGNNEPRYPDVNTNGTLSVYFAWFKRFFHFKGINKLYRDCLYWQLLCVICLLRDHVTLFLFLQSLIKQCHLFTNAFQFPFPHPMQCWKWSKIVHTLCIWGWGGGRGADRACVVKKSDWIGSLWLVIHVVKNRHTGKQDSHWEKTNKRKLPLLKMTEDVFVLSHCVPYTPAWWSDSSWEFLKAECEQIKTAQNNSYGVKKN